MSVMMLAVVPDVPSLIVGVPLALAPLVSCVRFEVVVPERKGMPRRTHAAFMRVCKRFGLPLVRRTLA
jgi:hypothetical protein